MSAENQSEAPKEPSSIKEVISEELERLGSGGSWIWKLFFLCVTPNILNGFHVSSYIFLGNIPEDTWCGIKEFQNTSWTVEQIRNISSDGLNSKGCTIWNWDYSQLSSMTFEETSEYTKSIPKPAEVSCMKRENSYFEYKDPDTTIVAEWDLICENEILRTSTQVLVSVGKFIGASLFGIISDKYGRRTSFILSSALYILSSILTLVAPWYSLFLLGRMGLGTAASGIFYSAFSLLTENIASQHRSRMSVAFASSYPIGMLFLALAAYLIPPWRYLQLSLTIPGLLLILNCYLLFESPRWLLTKNRCADAYRIVFKKKKDDLEISNLDEKENKEAASKPTATIMEKLKNSMKELASLFGQSKIRRMVLTCYFIWCATSLCYYVTALNAHNLAANRYLYVAITGCVDFPSYVVPIILLRFMGRRFTAFSLFVFSGVCLLVVLAIPQDHSNLTVFFAMFGRFGISAVYSIVTLHTAEMFPTEIRNSALGTCSTMAHVGSIVAPYIVDVLGTLGWFIPTTICGCSVLAAGLLMLTLPETEKRELSDRVEEEIAKKEQT